LKTASGFKRFWSDTRTLWSQCAETNIRPSLRYFTQLVPWGVHIAVEVKRRLLGATNSVRRSTYLAASM